MGCSVSAVPGQTQNLGDVRKAISLAQKPIKGVIQLAMVLKSSSGHSLELLKVNGSWNLHHALLDQPLDFFFMSSSTVTIVNQPGQGNYNAANTFLEAFCQFRHRLGLPASVLKICPIDGVGFVAENPTARKSLKGQGHYPLKERDFLEYLELSLRSALPREPTSPDSHVPAATTATTTLPWVNEAQIVMGLRSDLHPEDPQNRTHWRRDRRMGIYHNIKNTSAAAQGRAGKSSELQAFITQAADRPELLAEPASEAFLALEIGRKVYGFMLKDEADVDISLSLAAIGLDSLMAIELRRWWKQALRLEISVLEIMGIGTIEALGRTAAERLAKRFVGGGEEKEKE
ncbi:MAG: hypothetical protein Q9207_005347 [Kuettlingeria erythrocarpa]